MIVNDIDTVVNEFNIAISFENNLICITYQIFYHAVQGFANM